MKDAIFEAEKKNSKENVDFSKYKHLVTGRVRTFDVDRQNIVHNAVYLYWLELARVEYFREIGIPIERQTFITKHRFVVARVEIDYFWAAQFDDEYEVLTRITEVRNSSFSIEQAIRLTSGKVLLVANAVLVHLNPATHQPERISDTYRGLIREFEGADVRLGSEEHSEKLG